ncbi:MAG: hypothetical protein ACI9LE_002220 [Paraglaciecola sp.]
MQFLYLVTAKEKAKEDTHFKKVAKQALYPQLKALKQPRMVCFASAT